jgi:hypothetical protein
MMRGKEKIGYFPPAYRGGLYVDDLSEPSERGEDHFDATSTDAATPLQGRALLSHYILEDLTCHTLLLHIKTKELLLRAVAFLLISVYVCYMI